jgi:type 1 fimbria pilin
MSSNRPDGGYYTSAVTASIKLIKTGSIAPGSIVDPRTFPSMRGIITPPNNVPVELYSIDFTGSINFITSTCATPDVNVDMGTYGAAQIFNRPGATTPWVDASITLERCPAFSGRHADTSTQQIISNTYPTRNDNRVATLLTVSLTPASSIIDTANGVMAVDAAGSSGAAATGVGLQLGYTPNNINATATIPSTIWIPGMSWDVQPPNDGTSSFKIPLAARYFQTSNTVTPGPANARVTFNIDYK